MFVYILFLFCLLLAPEAEASFQDEALCGLISATDITFKNNYTEWMCNATRYTSTNPCSPLWTGLHCSGGYVNKINLYNIQIEGIIF